DVKSRDNGMTRWATWVALRATRPVRGTILPMTSNHSRRGFLGLAAAAVPALAQAQRDWSNQQPVRYPDPDFVTLDRSFAKYAMFNAVIYRHYVGTKWEEGPAWSAQGKYLAWG